MDITIRPGKLSGLVEAIPSKSQAHRLLICASFADRPTTLICPETNRDIEATVDCLRALGANICRTSDGYVVEPIREYPERATLPCCESGSTLRFMLPIVGALGIDGLFQMEGRLPQRPLSPLWDEMERMGCSLSRPTENTVRCTGKLRSGDYVINGGISSQFVTGLLLGLSLLPKISELRLNCNVESRPYINMTVHAIWLFGGFVPHTDIHYTILPHRRRSPGRIVVEGDWSNAAFWLAAHAMGSEIYLTNLNDNSAQGDRACIQWFADLTSYQIIDATHIPDLVPILSVVASANKGAKITGAHRLRIKESDRLKTTADLINNLGGCAVVTADGLEIKGTGLTGGTVNAHNDHRIAMAAAIAATVCKDPVTILGAECVEKSYPKFWAEYARLGGNYEQYLR